MEKNSEKASCVFVCGWVFLVQVRAERASALRRSKENLSAVVSDCWFTMLAYVLKVAISCPQSSAIDVHSLGARD